MNVGIIMEIMSDALLTAFLLAAPVLVVSVLVGLVVSIFQAATQIQEQTLSFVPKLVIIGLSLLLLGPWMLELMNDFTVRLFETIATYA